MLSLSDKLFPVFPEVLLSSIYVVVLCVYCPTCGYDLISHDRPCFVNKLTVMKTDGEKNFTRTNFVLTKKFFNLEFSVNIVETD